MRSWFENEAIIQRLGRTQDNSQFLETLTDDI